MLIGIDARMTPELLTCLAKMGHGDELVIADTNYPAATTAAHCTVKRPLQLPGLDASQAAELICTLFPLDGFVDYCALRMEVDNHPDEITESHAAVFDILRAKMPEGAGLGSLERQDFYAHARTCYAVIQCSEARPWGNFILRKGVVF